MHLQLEPLPFHTKEPKSKKAACDIKLMMIILKDVEHAVTFHAIRQGTVRNIEIKIQSY